MNRLKTILAGTGSAYAYALTTVVIAIIPESCFTALKINGGWSNQAVVIVGRLAICAAILAISNVAYACYQKHRKCVSVVGDNYFIQVEYGDLFGVKNGKVVVNFDECFTAKTGDRPFDVKPDSVCGQYLMKHPVDDIGGLIKEAGVMPDEERSLIDGRPRYKPGTIVPNGRYLRMSFAKLDKNGRGQLTYDEYLECLNTLWEELDLYHGTEDVYLPVLGLGLHASIRSSRNNSCWIS